MVDINKLSFKEEEGEFYSTGFVATTHPDRSKEQGFEGDILSKAALDQIADYINSGVATTNGLGSTRACSIRHDWIKQQDADMLPAGMAVPPATVKETGDGHWGVEVTTHHNKNHPAYKETIYDVQHGYYPGYSIEYDTKEEGCSSIQQNGKVYRIINKLSEFAGYAFANARKIANPSALISTFGYKEVEQSINDSLIHKENKEDDKMSEKEKLQIKDVEEPKEEAAPVAEESKEEPAAEEPKEESSSEDKKEEVETKTVDAPEKTEKLSVKEIADEASLEVKEVVAETKVQTKTLVQGDDNMESIQIKEMKEALKANDVVAYKEASTPLFYESNKVKETMSLLSQVGTVQLNSNLQAKCSGKGLKLQMKSTLGTGDNTSTYTQADVEFADEFAPGIIDTFNNQTNLFGFLKKKTHIGGEHVQWKMVTDKDPNSISTFVGHNDASVVKNFSNKSNYQTPLKIARRGISVTDFINRYSARSLGDLFQLEVDLQMLEMMNDVNAALFAEVADGTGNSPLGLEAVADSAGNTTLYGLTRSTANRLAPDTAGDTYTAVGGALTEALMRAKVTNLENEGVSFGNIAIVTSPTVRDFLFNLLDGNRRFNTTEASFGFNKANVPSWDGIPIVVDSDCNTDALYFIDTSSDIIYVGMAPTMISLAKVGASTEAYVQMDFAHVYEQPRRIGMLDTVTS
jgi:hypothetical protein